MTTRSPDTTPRAVPAQTGRLLRASPRKQRCRSATLDGAYGTVRVTFELFELKFVVDELVRNRRLTCSGTPFSSLTVPVAASILLSTAASNSCRRPGRATVAINRQRTFRRSSAV